MKSKKTKLRLRLLTSLLTGIFFFGLLVWGFRLIQNGPQKDETPVTLRKGFQLNEWVWSKFHSDQRMSPELKKPPPGKRPRQNGDLGLSQIVDLQTFRVAVDSGDQHLSLPISAFQALPKVGYSTLFKCIEGWSETIQYGGARFSEFMAAYRLGKKPDGTYYHYVGIDTPDHEYYVSIDIDSMLHPQTVLAYEMNDQALDAPNGAPLRLIIPIKYGIKNIKRIGRIFFSDERPPDYWAEQGYDWWSGL
jgi:DMSO/TMAO reductase YedYZ molybdopterin-dependent catalytic subunit